MFEASLKKMMRMAAKVRKWQGRGKKKGRGVAVAVAVAVSISTLLIISLVFLRSRSTSPPPPDHGAFQHGSAPKPGSHLKQIAIQQIESLFPKEVIDVITAHTDSSGPLSLNINARQDLSSSWVLDNPAHIERETDSGPKPENLTLEQPSATTNERNEQNPLQHTKKNDVEEEKYSNNVQLMDFEQKSIKENAVTGHSTLEQTPVKLLRRQLREKRREKRATELIQQHEEETIKLENAAIARSKEVDSAVLGKYSIWRHDNENENSDSTVRLMRDQLIMARVYSSIARVRNNLDIYHNLTLHIKESQHALGEANTDSDLHHSAPEKIKAMGKVLSKVREQLYDCAMVTKKLRAMLQSADEQVRTFKKQSTFLSQLAAKTVPKGLHCLSMRLTIEYYLLPLQERKFPMEDKLEDPNLYHYALFSDNVLAASVVVNSTIMNAKESEKQVFHLVTDKLNFGAMKMWFLLNSLGKAAINVENVDDYKWLNSSYCPVLRQLESAAMKEYYFKADRPTTLSAGSSNLKYRNPKYLSMLNHLRFYLPQVYPKLDKILFLDDDIVVQKDLSPLWSVDLHGKVNGAVETCGESFHRFDKYLNFSNPHIARNFDPNACGWAYGMNMFDLKDRNYDLLLRHQELNIVGEVLLKVKHCLLGLNGINGVRRVVSHPQALDHCKQRLRALNVAVEAVDNAAEAALFVAENEISDTAVICSRVAGREFGLRVLEPKMQDDDGNFTRFLVLAKNSMAVLSAGRPWKTTVAFSTETADLVKALSIFAENNIRVAKIESRPRKEKAVREDMGCFKYMFMVDLEGSIADPAMERAVNELEQIVGCVRILGSYPADQSD